ncbi:hypothetical protein TWF788_001451 [Orbilia oligospora]|uniref:Uncharacterized protein n=2 Tax=Orbilia oligospora TaxID=2813651 RepID=A0A7C8Q250_ORBOL|nr:hypothetical protein TWF788_001451 [Orbilia oligospora]
MDRQYQPRFTNPARHPNQSPNLSSASTPASPVAYHHPSHHGSPYAPTELKHHHHRPTKSFSSRNTPPPNSAYSSHGIGMDDRRYMSQPPPPPPPPHHQPPPHPPSHSHRPPLMNNNNNDKRLVYPGDRVPNPTWSENMDERFHDPRSYRQHEQHHPHPSSSSHPPPHSQHPLHPHHPPPHRDDRPVPQFHRQENATPPLSEGNSSGRSMLNASPQMYRDHSHQREHPPREHPREHSREHHHPPHFHQPGPPPPPPYPAGPNGPSLQSAQQQHHQLQQQLQQNGPPPPPPQPGHHSGPPQTGPFPPQPLFPQQQSQPQPHPPPPHPPGPHHHQRSASYSEPHHQQQGQPQYHHPSPHLPNRPASTTNRSMPPPSPPHYSRPPPGPPSHPQNFPPPPTGAPFGGGGRDLPSISSLEISREISRPSHMALSTILGDGPPGPLARLEPLSQSVYRDPARTLGPDLSPLKRPYTPGDRPIGGHAIEPSRSNSPPMNKPPSFPETRTPPYRPGPSVSRPRDPHFSPPTRPLSQPTFPPQPEAHPQTQAPPPTSQPHPHPPVYHHHQERIPERMTERMTEREPFPSQPPPHLRAQNHLRTSSYPESPYQRQITEPPRREPTPPRSVQPPLPRHNQAPNVSPPISQHLPPHPQPHPSPSYHHPAPPTSSAASLSFNAYTTQMPESPFAITPGLSNQHTISSLHQYDNDRKKPPGNTSIDDPAQILVDRLHDPKHWEREHLDRERSTDIPPLRAEEALVKGFHERKYPSSFANDQVSQSPKLKREVIVIDEVDSIIKKDDDVEMGGIELTHSPMKRADVIPVERAAKRRRGYYTAGSNLRSDSTLSNLEDAAAASLSGTPVKGTTTFTSVNPSNSNSTNSNSTSNNLPVIPPPQVIDNSEVIAELEKHQRHHLGSMVYTPTVLKKSGTVKSYSHIPLFLERENCTYLIRIPWYCLSLEERERVCKKRLLWGTEVYTDDSSILAVLVHLGYLPAVRDGAEVVEYASAHDAVLARLSAPKRRGAGRSREIAAAVMAEGGAPKTSASVQLHKDLLVKIVICGNLGEYRSVVKYGLKSRGWDGGHDGMGFMVEDVKWVDSAIGFGDVRGGKGVHERLKKWETMRKKNDLVETLVNTTTTTGVVNGKERGVKNVGSRWLVKEVVEKQKQKEREEEEEGGGEEKKGVNMDLDAKEGEKEVVVNGDTVATS